jgi:hypothetical protein
MNRVIGRREILSGTIKKVESFFFYKIKDGSY